MADINKLVEELGQLTVLEACELAKTMEEKWGIDLNNIQAAPAQAPASVEKATATVMLTGFGEKKINVLKAVKEILGLGLMEAKNFVEALPKPVEEEVEKERAEEIKKKLEDAGGTVELK
jgi:large subunit ribosomal protein L7/L12